MKTTLRWKLAQYFEKQWWKKYLHNKSVEEYKIWKNNYWKKILTASDLTIPDGSCVLDAGCGPSGIFMILQNQKVTAIDPLLNNYEKNFNHFKKSDYKNCSFINSTIENFNTEKYFDFLFCMNAINHVQDYELAMNKLAVSLKPSGVFVMTIDAHNYSLFKYLFRTIPGDILHPFQFNLEEYKSHIQKRGINMVKCSLIKKQFFFNHYLIVGKKN